MTGMPPAPDATVPIATWLIPASRLPILRATLHDITTLIDKLPGRQQPAVIAPTYTRIYAWPMAPAVGPPPSARLV